MEHIVVEEGSAGFLGIMSKPAVIKARVIEEVVVKSIEDITGIKICVPEEIAFNNGWIDSKVLKKAIKEYSKTSYGVHLQNVLNTKFIKEGKE